MTAHVARVYGWSWFDIRRMKYRTLVRFYSLIPELIAREKLEASAVSAFPHMETAARRSIYRDWLATAGLIDLDSPEQQTGKIGWEHLKDFVVGKPVAANALLNPPKKKE